MNNLYCRFAFALMTLASFWVSGACHADVRLPAFFSDHMVLQQEMPVKLWGWASPGEVVEVTLAENKSQATADVDGKWSVTLAAMKASKDPLTIRINGSQSDQAVEFKDVLIGEVWLCSGQSNMEWSVKQCANGDAEIAAADRPLIRQIKIPRHAIATPQTDVQPTEWKVCSPETAPDFTATGYFTAVNLIKELDVPIGLINSSWGGTRVEPWTSTVGMQQVPELAELFKLTMQRSPGTDEHQRLLQDHIASVENWLTQAKANVGGKEVTSASPPFPAELQPLAGRGEPTALYNGMIHALVGLPIRGALWYQGESNHREGMEYFYKKQALIRGWRTIWRQGDFPFFFVQIAPFQYGQENPEILAEFWEAQEATLALPNTGMVVINDIATLNDIHPPNKQDVGKRLAMLALKDVYGKQDLVARSPRMQSVKTEPGKLTVIFSETLKTRDDQSPSHFEIAGPGSPGFQPAAATIDGNTVVLTSEAVDNPTAFRFAWHKLAEPNLTGATGLPVGAVRGGKVPSFLAMLPGGDDYELVYDIDLTRLGSQINYDVDRSDEVKAFDRIGYLLELESEAHGEQKVFVSMKAFTIDSRKIGIPALAADATFQQRIESMQVYSNVESLPDGDDIKTGNIEFWPNNYDEENSKAIDGASRDRFDFGDRPYGNADGYGSMQVHDFGAKKTIFAINHWPQGANADIGIGNSSGRTRDWTFTRNANTYTSKRLRIYVRPGTPTR